MLQPYYYKFWLQVLLESLRIYPPAAGTARFTEQPYNLEGYDIPVGTAVMVCLICICDM